MGAVTGPVRPLVAAAGREGALRRRVASFPSDPPPPRSQIRVCMTGDSATLDLTGPTTRQLLDRTAYRRVVDRLGPDPLAGGRKSDVWRRVRQSRRPIGVLLLDQAVVAGGRSAMPTPPMRHRNESTSPAAVISERCQLGPGAAAGKFL